MKKDDQDRYAEMRINATCDWGYIHGENKGCKAGIDPYCEAGGVAYNERRSESLRLRPFGKLSHQHLVPKEPH